MNLHLTGRVGTVYHLLNSAGWVLVLPCTVLYLCGGVKRRPVNTLGNQRPTC